METELVQFTKTPAPEIPKNWEFVKADREFDEHIRTWRRLAGDVVSTLWIFYNKLAKPGKRTDLSENSERLPTWLEWLDSKGISDKTPINHFKALGWFPANNAHVSYATGENEWYTPDNYINAAKKVMGSIDTDPATTESANNRIGAKTFYTIENTGLGKIWKGNVWLNPPYSQPAVSHFCDTFARKFRSGEIKQGCVLINNATETSFAQKLLKLCLVVCFPESRIRFLDIEGNPKGVPLQGQMVIYFGKNTESFIKEFSCLGTCLRNVGR